MSPLKTSLIAALVSAALTAGCFYFVHNRRAQEIASLRYRNNRMLFQANQRRYAQAPDIRHTAAPAGGLNTVHPAMPAPALKPAEVYRNEGHATPLATLQTFAWACDRGDTEAVQKMLFFEGSTRTKAEAYLATLPENVRAQWKSVDEMAATLLTSSFMERPFPNADILEASIIEQVGPDRAIYRLPHTSKDRTQFQKTDDGWKYVITEAAVDAYISQATTLRPSAQP
jgi:hypothetical protein